jgi:RNA polymerase sigma-70 factor (ECF subfamily)
MVSPDLLVACKRGDREAFEDLVRATHRRVYSLALRLVGDRHDAEDVAQEAYLRMFRGLSGFREEARFETWMYRIVTNSAMNLLRRRGRFGEIVEASELDTPVPDQPFERTADRDQLSRGLSRLPDGQRTVILLKDVYGLSCREIGQEMGLEEGAVKVRLHRARRRLKDLLTEASSDELREGSNAPPRVRRRRAGG